MIDLRLRCMVFCLALASLLASSLALSMPPPSGAQPSVGGAAQSATDDGVALPPAPTAATPASAMRLPNLPALGNSDPYSAAPAAAAPPAAPPPASPARVTPLPASNSPAAIELRKLDQRTGLSDAQLAALQAARAQLAGGNEDAALRAAQGLSRELDSEAREYLVGDGQNLFAIAGRPEVYANSNLWPLLWWANLPGLREPWQLSRGMRLKVPAHPTVEQVAKALSYARSHNVLTAGLDYGDLPAGVSPP